MDELKETFCLEVTAGGHPCYRLRLGCPLHRPEEVNPTPDVVASSSPARMGQMALEMMDQFVAGKVSSKAVVSVIRALAGMDKLPVTEEEEDRQLREVELRGMAMNGFAPRTAEEWRLAMEAFGPNSVLENFRFFRVLPGSEAIPVDVVDELIALAAKKNHPGFRIPQRMLKPTQREGVPDWKMLPYNAIE